MRFRKHRRSARTSGRSFFKRSHHRGGGSSGGSDIALIGGALAYGATREWLSAKAQPLTSKLGFLGQYADEATFGTAGYLMMKGKVPGLKGSTARSIGKAILIVEAARVGSNAAGGLLGGGGASSSGSSAYLYG